MRRKLIQHGPHSLGISLPSSWLRDRKLEKGDTVRITEADEGLLVTERCAAAGQTATIDIDGYNTPYLTKRINQLYEDGYAKIILHFKKAVVKSPTRGPVPLKEKLEYLVGRLIGLEIVSWKKNSVEIQFMFSSSTLSLAEIQSKILNTIRYAMNNMEEALATGDRQALKMGQELHDNITKFVSLGKREIRLSKASRTEYLSLTLFDKMADHLRHCYKSLYTTRSTGAKVTKALKCIHKPYKTFEKGYLKKDPNKLNKALQERHEAYVCINKQKSLPYFVYLYAGVLEMVILLVENTVVPET